MTIEEKKQNQREERTGHEETLIGRFKSMLTLQKYFLFAVVGTAFLA